MHTQTMFNDLPWTQVTDLVRQKSTDVDDKTVRLLELQDGFEESQWCYKGHIGIVVSGAIEVEYEDHKHTYYAGDVMLLPTAVGHKAKSSGKTMLFLVDG